MKILNQLYAYVWQGQDNNCNSYLFSGLLEGDRHVLVDPGYRQTPRTREPGLERLYAEMRRDGLDPEAIGLILLTHCHPDHFEGAGRLRQQTRALVAIHRLEADIYAKFGGSADLLLEEGELKLGIRKPIQLEVFHSPGHSPGHVTFYWKKEKVLIAGDVVFYHSTGRTDLPGGSPGQLKESIARLAKLDTHYLLCGHPYGHPGVIVGKQEVRENFEFLSKTLTEGGSSVPI